MLSAKLALLVPLLLIALGFAAWWLSELRWARSSSAAEGAAAAETLRPSLLQCGIGFLTDFLDTLGIGSFATTTSLFRLKQVVADRLIPGTLNVGHALPTVVQALIYIVIVEVDPTTLALMVAAATVGAYVGASLVAGWSERWVRLAMGLSLLAAAALLTMRLLQMLPAGSDSTALSGWRLLVGVLGNLVLGALMTMGVGLYAPCMILVALLDMNPKAAFPIMMGSCAFLMPVASLAFLRRGRYAPRAALGLTLGGIPAVVIAAYLVGELPLDAVRWLVLIVVVYTAQSLLRAARRPAASTLSA